MRIGGWILAIRLLCPLILYSAVDAPVQLAYPMGVPVGQRSRVTVEMTQRDPVNPVYISVYQEADAQITLDEPPTMPPYALTMTLNRLRVGLEYGDRKTAFDSQSPQESPLFAAFSKIIGKPISMTVGDRLQIVDAPPDVQRLMKDLKLMSGFTINHLISELVQRRFALANQPLEVGNSYRQVLKQGIEGASPIEMTYRIVEISPTEVRAIVEGTIPESTMLLTPGSLGIHGIPSLVKATGTIDGKAVWNRENALVYRSKLYYLYRGSFVSDESGKEIPFELRMIHQDGSQLDIDP